MKDGESERKRGGDGGERKDEQKDEKVRKG